MTLQIRTLEATFESYAKMDKLVWLNERADKTIQGLDSLHQKAIHDAVRRFKAKRSSSTAFRVEISPGVQAGSYTEERKAFRAHWSKMLDGESVTFAELVRLDRSRWGSHVTASGCLHMDLGAIPSRIELTRRFVKSKQEAVPEDGLGG